MSESKKHTDYLEQMPLLVAGTLSETSKSDLLRHLQRCPDCRKVFEQERALFAVATAGGSEILFEDHLTEQTIDEYLFAPAQLAPGQREEIDSHLETCGLCRNIIEEMRSLPKELDRLVDQTQIPLITAMTAEQGRRSGAARIVDISRKLFWQPLAGYAAAAALLIVSIVSQLPMQDEVALISARLSPHSRGQDSIAVFYAGADECILELSYYLDPEADHKYNLMIEATDAGKPSYYFEDYRDFDAKGNLNLRLLLTTGSYQLRILDILDADTVAIVQQFLVKSESANK